MDVLSNESGQDLLYVALHLLKQLRSFATDKQIDKQTDRHRETDQHHDTTSHTQLWVLSQ